MNITWHNPIMARGADPWLIQDGRGGYYFTCTNGVNITLWHVSALDSFDKAEKKTVWTPPAEGPGSRDLWAPELHLIGGRWYVYYAASDGTNDAGRRMHVIVCDGEPMTGNWSHLAILNTARAGLDGTVLRRGGEMYFLYAGYGDFPEHGSAVYIVRMKDVATLTGEETCLTWPEFEWERQGGMPIDEGPAILYRNGRIFVVFSASTTWSEDYCLGLLTVPEDADLMKAENWRKSPEPVFKKCPEHRVLAPGHNSFCMTPDGDDLIVYHAIDGEGGHGYLDDTQRSTRIQPFAWREDGTPDFGIPAACE